MPTTIILLLAAAPILTLSMISATDWSPETLAAARLALAASLVIVVLWVVADAIRALSGSQFTSRPY
jgi:hypothetical protein